MIKRLYIDNYKCFVNFEVRPSALNLFLGGNGSGKSTVFEVLARMRSMMFDDARVSEAFPASSLTAWDSRSVQRFEIDWAPKGVLGASYVLEVEHDRVTGTSRIKSEKLSFEDGTTAYAHDGTNVTVAGDEGRKAVTFGFSSQRSYLSTVDHAPPGAAGWEAPSAQLAKMPKARLSLWKMMIGYLRIFKLDAGRIGSAVSEIAADLSSDGRSFAAWYSRLLQERPDLIAGLQQDFSDVMEGFRTLRVVPSQGGARHLVATFSAEASEERSATYDLPFEELSEGQRALVVLYTILRTQPGGVACFDEPDNFVALPEIQPWLVALSTAVEAGDGQAFVISHHPEVIDYLAPSGAVVFERPNGGPSRLKPLSVDRALGLKASEIIARGWHDAT